MQITQIEKPQINELPIIDINLILEIKQLQFQFKDSPFHLAIDYLGLSPKEFVGVVGRSGCGKTTFLRILLGELKANSYIFRLSGHLKPGTIGYVSQNDSLIPWYNVFDNISWPLKSPKISRPPSKYIDNIIKLTGLRKHLQKYPDQLSGGQKRRVMLARALIYRPGLLLLDEPTAGLDIIARDQIVDLLLKVQQFYSYACIYVSHDIDDIILLAQNCYIFTEPGIINTKSIELPLQKGSEFRYRTEQISMCKKIISKLSEKSS